MEGPAARLDVRRPSARHALNRIDSRASPKDLNTVAMPEVDVAADIEAIRRGQARWNRQTQRYELPNGRIYGVEGAGTVFPVSGPGLVRLSRGEYQALLHYIRAGGNRQRAETAMARNPFLTQDDKRRAFSVFQHHKSYQG